MERVSTSDLIDGLLRAARGLRRSAGRHLAPLGLTPAQERTLRHIARYPDGIRMGELAAALSVVPRSATSLVEGLEAAGLVERSMDPTSRRSVLVALSRRGRAAQADLARARLEAGEELFGRLDDQERATLAALLDRIAAPGPPSCPT